MDKKWYVWYALHCKWAPCSYLELAPNQERRASQQRVNPRYPTLQSGSAKSLRTVPQITAVSSKAVHAIRAAIAASAFFKCLDKLPAMQNTAQRTPKDRGED